MPSELLQAPPCSPRLQSYTPPASPILHSSSDYVTLGQLKNLFLENIKAVRNTNTIPSPNVPEPAPAGDADVDKPRERASRLEYKRVDEIWDEIAFKYKIINSSAPTAEIKELDEYVFVVRERIDRRSMEPTFYIDVKAEGLRDMLRTVLRGVNGICLREDKPTVERNLLYNFLPELETYRQKPTNEPSLDPASQKHIDLLIDYVKSGCASTTERLDALLKKGEITYDLLWALFKPGSVVYTTCRGTRRPRCVVFDYGEEKTRKNEMKYYGMTCHFLDFDGDILGEATVELEISKFRGTRRIRSLDAYPLRFHPEQNKVKTGLLECGKKFINLRGSHHVHCTGTAFTRNDEGSIIRFSVDGRIMADAAFFRKNNPDYFRPRVSEVEDKGSCFIPFGNVVWGDEPKASDVDELKYIDLEPTAMTEKELLICCPTVPGFSFGEKIWGEFAVADIADIEWSSAPYDCLTIPDEHKNVLMALVGSHVSRPSGASFDDFVTGKGRGINILLHGSPGLGKTLTAEAVSEHLHRPLYSISAGELPPDAAKLEVHLSHIFEIAAQWNATLLLDEADVYLERRSSQDLIRNGLVSVFLRKLEYCEGILFMTTNRAAEFDEAILSRIHLMLKYEQLDHEAKTEIWCNFLKRADTIKGRVNLSKQDFQRLISTKFNGRQIKNIVATAHALATKDQSVVTFSYLQQAVRANEKFIREFTNADHIDRMFS